MRAKSWTGVALALAYACLYGGAYVLYVRRADEWFADLPVVTVAMPYIYVARALSGGDYSFSGDMTGVVIGAAAFGMALAYLCGWALETALRSAWRLARALRGKNSLRA